jgi:hypothetical protein
VAAGDLNGDGVPEIVTVSGARTAGHVKAFNGRDGSLVGSFFAPSLTFGVLPPTQLGSLASAGVADVNGDGRYETIVGTGPKVQATVGAFDLTGTAVGNVLRPFTPFLGGLTATGLRE